MNTLVLGRALAHFVWEGAIIAALLAAILYSGPRSSRLRYGLAVGALLAMVMSFAVTLALCAPARDSSTVLHFAPQPHLYVVDAAEREPASSDGLAWLVPAWLVPAWMAGVIVCYARIFIGWLAALRLRRRGVCAAPAAWQSRLNEFAAQLKVSRPVVLLESCLADVPVVIGWFRPVILAPLGLLAGLPAGQVEAILIHELAHVRRYDYAVNLLQGFVEGFLFYHPAVWWISNLARVERENCCDDVVVAHCPDARAYAVALATLEQNRPITGEAILAATGGNLMKRIQRLLEPPKQTQRNIAPALAVGLLLLIAMAGSIQTMSAARVVGAPVALPPVAPVIMPPAVAPTAAPAKVVPPAERRVAVADSATPAAAQEAPEKKLKAYQKWLKEDAAYLITAQERAAFVALTTNEERADFIKQFWDRRNPTPGAADNPFKTEHYRRIAYANERFSSAIPGWKTDRGRIYITYGPPDEIDAHVGVTVPQHFEKWMYHFIEGIGKDVVMRFDDVKNDGEYRLAPGPK